MRAALGVIGLIILFVCQSCSQKVEQETHPNILLIVADDLGYSDLGCYGGEIRTPNIDQLAKNGLRFSRFHTSPMCAPTRAMMLSGLNNHAAGMGNQDGVSESSPLFGQIGYEGHLSDRIIPIPELLKESGYRTYMAGKWHLGKAEESSPANNGFERSYALLQGGANHFNDIGIEPSDTLSLYREDGKLTNYPEGEYSTEVYTNKIIEFIKSNSQKKSQPFFAFASYTSPHWPLQVPNEYLHRYSGEYDVGYDSLRVLRFESSKEAGMIPLHAKLPPRLDHIKPWIELTSDEKKIEARKMELYAAMVDNLDYHIGRLIQFLKTEGLYENTIIIFMSDNGPAGIDFNNDFLRDRYQTIYENMGSVNSFVSYGAGWAQAGAAPFNRHKRYTTEGGTNTPFIISGKKILAAGEIRDTFISVMDLAPTFYEWAGVTYPGSLATEKTKPLLGQSMAAYLENKVDFIHDENYGIGMEHRGRTFYRKGDWKIVNLEPPYDEGTLKLFNLENDLGETTDLRSSHPEKFQELLNEWRRFIEEHEIIIGK